MDRVPASCRRRRQAGMSLVELMVALGISAIAVAAMTGVFRNAEGQKRSTVGSDDAQNIGALALHTLQRDLQQSGHGTNAFLLMGCGLTLRSGVALGALGPVTINPTGIPAGDPGSDVLLVVYSNSNGAPEGELVQAQPATAQYVVGTPTAPASGTATYRAGDRVVAQPQPRPSPCALALDTVGSTTAPSTVTVGTGLAGMTGGVLYNLGTAPRVVVYRVRNQSLTACDYMVSNCADAAVAGSATVWVPVAGNVIGLRAQYGRDTSVSMDAVLDAFDQTTPTTQCGWARVLALRLALAIRNTQYDRAVVTNAAPTWAGSATAPFNLSKNPDGSDHADWNHYRYRVVETVVPMRNMAWLGVPSGC